MALPPRRRRRATLGVLVVAQTLGVANANLIAVALPALSAELAPSPAQAQWIVDAYVLVLASALVCAGSLGDRLGRRRLLLGGLVTFALASLACALARDPALLIGLRAVQALGPALILPASLAILAATHPGRRERAAALGVWGAASGLGIALGPLLGGVLVSGLGWRWAFAANVPVALLLAGLAALLVHADRPEGGDAPLDWRGALLVVGGMACLVFAVIQGPHDGWTSTAVLLAAGVAVVALWAFGRVERRARSPLVDLALLRHRPFVAANLAAGTVLFVSLAVSVYLSGFLQDHRDASPLQAGLALLPLGIGTGVLAIGAGRLTAWAAPAHQIAGGLALCVLGALLLARLDADSDAGSMLAGLAFLGAGGGVTLPASTAAAVGSVPGERTGMASAVHNASRQLGATLGVAVVGSIVAGAAAGAGTAGYVAGLHAALLFCAGLLVAVLVLVLALAPRGGAGRPTAPAGAGAAR